MRSREEVPDAPRLDYEAWRDLLRSMSGRYYSEGIKPHAFCGWVCPLTVSGFKALDISSNAHRVERTYRDVRFDGADHYFALFLASGALAMTHNDQAVRLAPGYVALVDAARPVTYSSNNGSEPWNTVALCLPRQTLSQHEATRRVDHDRLLSCLWRHRLSRRLFTQKRTLIRRSSPAPTS
jgi:AraC family transcriptional regulator, positive regulator of tynA and feaB